MDIYKYLTKEEYEKECKSLKAGKTKRIFKNENLEIDIKKVGRKVYTIINNFTHEKKLNEALRNINNLL